MLKADDGESEKMLELLRDTGTSERTGDYLTPSPESLKKQQTRESYTPDSSSAVAEP